MASSSRGPIRPDRPPISGDVTEITNGNGSNAAPAAALEYPPPLIRTYGTSTKRRAVEQQGEKREADKNPGGEQVQRHHRPIAPPLLDDHEEQDERDRGDTGSDSRAGPSASSRADRPPPYERTDPDSSQSPAESIQGQAFSVLVRRDVAQG